MDENEYEIWLEEEEYAFEDEIFLRRRNQNETQVHCKRSFESNKCV